MLPATLANPNEPRVSVLADAIHKSLSQLDFGSVVTYEDLRKVIFEDPQSSRGRQATLRAAKRLLSDDRKLLINVRGKGYQIAQPNEHAGRSKRVDALARKRVRKALAIVVYAEMEKLTPTERQQIDEQANRLRLKIALEKRLSRVKTLPSRADVKMPTGKELVRLLTAAS